MRNIMAAICNFFLPGLGHLILGKPFSGLMWFITLTVLYALSIATSGLGLFAAIPFHLVCIARASAISRAQQVEKIYGDRFASRLFQTTGSANSKPLTGKQIEYAQALGIALPANVDREQASQLIDNALSQRNTVPVKNQIHLARVYGLETEGIDSFDEMVDVLYRQIKARRWVFSVLRHLVQANWTKHFHSGLPDQYANEIALALQSNDKLFAKIEERQGGNVSAGGDVWYRITQKAVASSEYQFVKNYDLPDNVLKQINVPRAEAISRGKGGSGCVPSLLMIGAVVAVAIYKIVQAG